jgi:hypothetical protein
MFETQWARHNVFLTLSAISGKTISRIQRSDPSELQIQITAFIPQNNVPDPYNYLPAWDPATANHVFEGDARGYSHTSLSYRMRQKVTLLTFQEDSASGEKPGSRATMTGITRAYDSTTSLDAAGNLTAAAKADNVQGHPLLCSAAIAGTGGMSITVTRLSNRKVQAYFRAAANNPLVTSPDIDWEFTMVVDSTNESNPTYHLTGQHDGFPGYDVYINGQFIYGHDPRATGDGPLSLLPPMEYDNINETGDIDP